ncbi:tyrosine-protein phosphatase [Bacteroidales bacterium OttesenSCG-928-C19]|nr:tyrosine-protein phosphatase [Bacteroidales bacterium OttesenSCG-928-C19]
MKKAFLFILGIGFLMTSCHQKKEEKSGRLTNEQIPITVRTSNEYQVSLHNESDCMLAYSEILDMPEYEQAEQVTEGSFVLNFSDATKRLLFGLQDNKTKNTMYTSERRLNMTGAPNFRDAGGMVNKQGKQVRWGKLYRSGTLNGLSETDWKLFASLGIKKVIDFRTPSEIENEPDNIPESLNVESIHAMIGNPAAMENAATNPKELTKSEAIAYMTKFSRDFVHSIHDFKPVFDALTENDNPVPFLFHCTAGKDRTGMAAALILMTLDVDRDVIMNDYLLSNQYALPYYLENKDKMSIFGFNDDVIEVMGGVRQEYLQTSFDMIDSTYGSFEVLLEEVFGITPEQRLDIIEKYTY